jgi:hypothetical protein
MGVSCGLLKCSCVNAVNKTDSVYNICQTFETPQSVALAATADKNNPTPRCALEPTECGQRRDYAMKRMSKRNQHFTSIVSTSRNPRR